MKAFYYIYTATAANDYCSLVSPDNTFFNSKDVKEHFIKRVRNLINTDAYGDQILEMPIWLLIKEGDLILWGVGCKTSELSNQTDDFGRTLRTFIGIFIKKENISEIELPYDMEFFKKAFEDVILPQWNIYTSGITNIKCNLYDSKESIKPAFSASHINTDYHYCRAFNSSCTDAKLLFEQVLGIDSDVSIASNIVDLKQTTNSNGGVIPLMNALCPILSGQYKDIKVEHECKKCGKLVYDLQDGICLACWEEGHRPPIIPNTSVNNVTPKKIRCRQCCREYDFVLSDGLCEKCHDDEHEREWRYEHERIWRHRLTIIITAFIIIGILLFVVPLIRSCTGSLVFHKNRTENASHPYGRQNHQTLPKGSSETDSTQKNIVKESTEVIDDPSFTGAVKTDIKENN